MILDGLPKELWLRYWRFWAAYHRYEVRGLDRLGGEDAAMIAGYHGTPLAYDMCMLTMAIHDRFGYLPHGIVHRGLDSLAATRWLTDQLGFVTNDGPGMVAAVDRGEHIVATPGGGQEGQRDFWHRYEVAWGDRVGYVRIAVKYGLPIIPVAAAGADDTYIGLNDAEATARALGIPRDWAWPLWVGLGPLGLYPFSPPFPIRMLQLVGEPIHPQADGPVTPDDRDGLLRVHRRVVGAVQDLLDHARREAARS